MDWTLVFNILYVLLIIALIFFLVVVAINFYKLAKAGMEFLDSARDLVEDTHMKISTFDEVFETIGSIIEFVSDIGTKVTKYLKFKDIKKTKNVRRISMRKKGKAKTFIFGAGIGALLGLLFAPKKVVN